MSDSVFIHPSAEVSQDAVIGSGTKVWHQAQIMSGAAIGKNCILGKSVFVDSTVSIGDGVKIQNGVSVYRGVTVESNCFLGPHMVFTNDLTPRSFVHDFKITKTLLKQGASVGANATLICGITLGEYCMVGAGSVVSKDVPPYTLVVGNPAKAVGFVCKCGKRAKESKNPKTPPICQSCVQPQTL